MVIFCKKMVWIIYLCVCVPVDEIVWYAGELGLDQDEQAPTEVKHVPRGAGRTLLFPEQEKKGRQQSIITIQTAKAKT